MGVCVGGGVGWGLDMISLNIWTWVQVNIYLKAKFLNHKNVVKHVDSKSVRAQIKRTVSDKKNLQIPVEIKKHTFQSQHVPFCLKKCFILTENNFLKHFIQWALFLSTGKFP